MGLFSEEGSTFREDRQTPDSVCALFLPSLLEFTPRWNLLTAISDSPSSWMLVTSTPCYPHMGCSRSPAATRTTKKRLFPELLVLGPTP